MQRLGVETWVNLNEDDCRSENAEGAVGRGQSSTR